MGTFLLCVSLNYAGCWLQRSSQPMHEALNIPVKNNPIMHAESMETGTRCFSSLLILKTCKTGVYKHSYANTQLVKYYLECNLCFHSDDAYLVADMNMVQTLGKCRCLV